MRHVAFLRAVNVGGRTVKMDRLKGAFDALDLANVTTFIASGNVVFDSRRGAEALERVIEARLARDFGFSVTTMIRSIDELRAIQAYVAAEVRPLSDAGLHVGLLKAAPLPAAAAAAAGLSNEIDQLRVHGRELYWSAGRGVGQTTVSAARLEKLLATPVTFRNVHTVDRILQKFTNG